MTNAEALQKAKKEISGTQMAYSMLGRVIKAARRNGKPDDEIGGIETVYWDLGSRLKILKRSIMYFEDMLSYYPDIYYSKRHTDMRVWEKRLGWHMADLFSINSMADFGCALGSYMEGAMEYGVNPVLGVEILYEKAKPYIPNELDGKIIQGDVGQPMDLGRKYDCAFSIEVAEHLPEELADNFIDNLIRASGRLIIVSASNRGGHYHINQKGRSYWIGKFVLQGCRYSAEDTEMLINLWRVKGCPRYIQENLMVFWAGRYA